MPPMHSVRLWRSIAAVTLLAALSACATVVQIEAERAAPMPAAPIPLPAPGFGVDLPMFPECENAGELAFAGEATLSAIGLGDVGGPDADKPGMIWVTADPVAMPVPPGFGAEEMPMQRMVCVQWADGSGMSTNVPDGWQLPADFAQPAAGDTGDPAAAASQIELGPIAVLIAAVVLIGFSVIAFRGGDGRSASESSPG
jgi:hypothetical protein